MTLGDGIRRNITSVDPTERALLRDALIELNQRFFPGNRTDQPIPGGVSWWFKQDEIHQATHVHGGPEFLPWHREIVNRLEGMLRQINPQLSLHYWDWTQDPRAIPNANLGGGATGTFNLFTPDFMGYGGPMKAPIGEPWLSAGYYVPGAVNFRSQEPFDLVNNNPADPPRVVDRSVSGSPTSVAEDTAILNASDYAQMSQILEDVHDSMHSFVNMGGLHTSFRDPFVFLLHSNVDRLFARWQTDSAHPERLAPDTVYGSLSGDARMNSNIKPWSGMPSTVRPWASPENEQVVKTYKDPSVVTPPLYDTNPKTWTSVSEGSSMPGAPVTAVALGPDRLALFLADHGGGVYSTSGNPIIQQWAGWKTVSEGSTMPGGHVTAVDLGNNQVAVFIADPSGVVYSTYGNPITQDWESWDIKTVAEGKSIPGAPITAVALGQNRVALFLADPNGGVYAISGDPVAQTWGRWEFVPDRLTTPGAPITPMLINENQVAVFFADAHGEVFSAYGEPALGGWLKAKTVSEGSTTPGGHVTAVDLGFNIVAVFIADPSGAVYSTCGNPMTQEWESWDIKTVAEGKSLPGAPITAVALGQNRVALFLADPNGGVYAILGNPVTQTWGRWEFVPDRLTTPGAPITAVALDQDHIALFMADAHGEVYSSTKVMQL